MRFANDLTGQSYGRLTVLGRAPNQGHKVMWRCRCECGAVTTVQYSNLVYGLTRSCGCYQRERTREVLLLRHK